MGLVSSPAMKGSTVSILTHRTQGVLVEILSNWSHGQIGTLLRKVNLTRFDPGQGTDKAWINKQRRLQAVFDGADRDRNEQTSRDLLDLVLEIANTGASDPDHLPDWLTKLREQLLSDGYELVQVIEQVGDGWSSRNTATYRLLPVGPAPAPLAPVITALEHELQTRGYDVARNHYGQAVRNYVSGDLEAANSQLRAFLEDLFVVLARTHANFTGGEPLAALQRLQHKQRLLNGEFDLLRGLWALSQQRGAHAGLTNAAEALFRLQTTTSSCLFLLRHLS